MGLASPVAAAAATCLTTVVVVALLITSAASQSYTNHTVGDSAGWLFNAGTNTSSTNYTKWASTQLFNLGDFLIFNTTTNQTVVHTYNRTTYRSCDSEDALDSDTSIYAGVNEIDQPLTLAVPLTIKGVNYFFSDVNDGVQCAQGMAFEIDVNQGLGLPPSLNQPPPPRYTAPPPPPPPSTTPSVTSNQGETFYNAGSKHGGNMSFGILLLFLALM